MGIEERIGTNHKRRNTFFRHRVERVSDLMFVPRPVELYCELDRCDLARTNPITGSACSACETKGQPTTALPRSEMKSRRLIVAPRLSSRHRSGSNWHIGSGERMSAMGKPTTQCPLWVRSGHGRMSDDVRFTPKSGHCNAQLGDAAIRRARSCVSSFAAARRPGLSSNKMRVSVLPRRARRCPIPRLSKAAGSKAFLRQNA